MKRINPPRCFLAALFTMALVIPAARAAEIPLQALQNWNIYNRDGWILLNQGQYDRAEKRFRMAIEEIRPYVKSDYRLLARSYADLARVFYHQGRYADAEPLAKWALLARESRPNPDPNAIFQSLYTLALIHAAQDHFDQAEPLLKRALDLQEKAIGPTHIQTAATLDELAGVCAEKRKFREAENYYLRAIAIYLRFNPGENLDLASCSERYAAMLERMDRPVNAAKLRERAKEIRDTVESRAALKRDTRPWPSSRGSGEPAALAVRPRSSRVGRLRTVPAQQGLALRRVAPQERVELGPGGRGVAQPQAALDEPLAGDDDGRVEAEDLPAGLGRGPPLAGLHPHPREFGVVVGAPGIHGGGPLPQFDRFIQPPRPGGDGGPAFEGGLAGRLAVEGPPVGGEAVPGPAHQAERLAEGVQGRQVVGARGQRRLEQRQGRGAAISTLAAQRDAPVALGRGGAPSGPSGRR